MRVLVVEDEHRIANTIKKGLEQEHYAVDIAYDGEDGYDLAASEDYDLIMLDLMLPGMDGLSICKKLRQENVHTPVLILTAKSQTKDKVVGLDTGADDYLTKPFSFEELLARVRALSRRPKQSISTLLKVKDLELDTTSFSVKRDNHSINLSAKEYSLLEFLMRQPNFVISKDKLIAHVWDYESNILPNTVEVFIRNLRNKIDRPFNDKEPLIHTVRGFGYKIGDK